MTTRQELQAQFVELRNAKMKKGHSKRDRNIYFDWIADSEILAQVKTDQELINAINKMKE